jgi:SM-20-related protein
MPAAEFFKQFGLFTVRNFLSRAFCESLCREMSIAPMSKGTFLKLDSDTEIEDENIKRRSETIALSKESSETIRHELLNLKPEIEKHFQIELTDLQPLKFCIYKKGDFYKAHVDRTENNQASNDLRERKVSVILFLNEESLVKKKGAFSGGNLTFYGLMQNEAFAGFGLPLMSEPGMLIAFLPSQLHEVTPVTTGTRYTIVTWYI